MLHDLNFYLFNALHSVTQLCIDDVELLLKTFTRFRPHMVPQAAIGPKSKHTLPTQTRRSAGQSHPVAVSVMGIIVMLVLTAILPFSAA